jgi:hypothetical protein
VRKKKRSPVRLAVDVAFMGACVIAEQCFNRMEKKWYEKEMSETALKRKLAFTGFLFHALGILYND